MTQTDDLKELAPTGRLRGGVVIAPAKTGFFAIKDGQGAPHGVTVDLLRFLSGETKLPLAPDPLGIEDRAHPPHALLEIAIDNHVIVFRPVAHFIGGFRHPRAHHFLAVLSARSQPLLECRDARRQDEDGDEILAHRRLELLRPLPVDVTDDVMPGLDPGIHRAVAPWIAGSGPAMTSQG